MRGSWNLTTATGPSRHQFTNLSAPCAWSDAQAASWSLTVATNNFAGAERAYTAARRELGVANRRPAAMRRHWQGRAMRTLNARRAQLRAARSALAAAIAHPALLSKQPAS